MMTRSYQERRRSIRVHCDGMALLWGNDRIVGRYRLADLSIDGCQLRDGPSCTLGAEYGLVLDLDTETAVRVPVKLVRQRQVGFGQYVLGLQLAASAPWTEERMHHLIMQNLEREFPPTDGRFLVVDADVERRTAVAESLRRIGCTVLQAGSPAEALWELEQALDVRTAFVARKLGPSDGRNLVRVIGARYPGVRRVLVAESHSNEGHDAHAVLVGPFDRPRLRSVLPHALLTAATQPLKSA